MELSAAVGYSAGAGADIEAVIKKADDFMYANKAAAKAARQN